MQIETLTTGAGDTVKGGPANATAIAKPSFTIACHAGE
jgi:hypothetical protein